MANWGHSHDACPNRLHGDGHICVLARQELSTFEVACWRSVIILPFSCSGSAASLGEWPHPKHYFGA